MENRYKIVYMGTPEFALAPLKALDNNHEILALVTQPNRINSRGRKSKDSPLKKYALDRNINILQPENVNSKDFLEILEKLDIDFIVVVAYGQYIGKKVRDLPKEKIVNIHASLLPKYRGAAPIHRAIMNREEITGNSIMEVAKGLDQGDVYLKNEIKVGRKTLGQLHDELSESGAKLILDYLNLYRQGKIIAIKQDESQASYAEKISREDGVLDFQDLDRTLGQILGLSPRPGASFYYKGQRVKAINAEIYDREKDPRSEIGQIISVDDKGILVNANNGKILIDQIQFPGKRIMSLKEFLLGNTIEKGTIVI